MSLVAVLDYGCGNVHSVTRAVAAAGADAVLTADPEICGRADGLVVPGVGAFAACMSGLSAVDGPRIIAERVRAALPVLGICVGHQVMFTRGIEHGSAAAGLGLLPGVVERVAALPLPHMGWNTVAPPPGTRMLAGVETERFYFVHSYAVHALPGLPSQALPSWTEHGGDRFLAAVEYGSLWTTQFHPEKSGEAGAWLLRNWIETLTEGV